MITWYVQTGRSEVGLRPAPHSLDSFNENVFVGGGVFGAEAAEQDEGCVREGWRHGC